MKMTAQGIARGHLLLGPLEPEGDDHLMMVTRVNGANSVTCLVNTGKVCAEVTLNTALVQGTEPDYKRVRFSPSLPRNTRVHGGLVIDRYQGAFDA